MRFGRDDLRGRDWGIAIRVRTKECGSQTAAAFRAVLPHKVFETKSLHSVYVRHVAHSTGATSSLTKNSSNAHPHRYVDYGHPVPTAAHRRLLCDVRRHRVRRPLARIVAFCE